MGPQNNFPLRKGKTITIGAAATPKLLYMHKTNKDDSLFLK